MDNARSDHSKFLITASVAILVFYLPYLLHHYLYRDDFDRVITGNPGWTELGRPFGDAIALLFTADWTHLTDSAPLFLIVSMVFIVISTCKALELRKVPYNQLTAVLFIAALFNPLYIECFLYRFDSIIMAAAFSCAVLAWGYFPESKIKSFILCFCALNFYQSFINVFIVLLLLESNNKIFNGSDIKKVFKYFSMAIVLAFLSALLYYVIIKLFIGPYAYGKSTFVLLDDKGIFHYYPKLFENAYSRYWGFLSPTGKVIYGIAVLISIIEIQLRFYKDTAYSYPAVRAFICTFVLIFFLPLCLGILLGVVGNGLIAPRLIVSGIFFSVILLYLTLRFATRLQPNSKGRRRGNIVFNKFTWILIFLFLMPPLAFSYIVNNDIRYQNERDRFLVDQLANSLETFPRDKPVYLLGGFEVSRYVDFNTQRMRLARHLVSTASDWTLWLHLKQYGYDNIYWGNVELDVPAQVTAICNSDKTPILIRRNYEFYDMGGYLLVWLGTKDMCQHYKIDVSR